MNVILILIYNFKLLICLVLDNDLNNICLFGSCYVEGVVFEIIKCVKYDVICL